MDSITPDDHETAHFILRHISATLHCLSTSINQLAALCLVNSSRDTPSASTSEHPDPAEQVKEQRPFRPGQQGISELPTNLHVEEDPGAWKLWEQLAIHVDWLNRDEKDIYDIAIRKLKTIPADASANKFWEEDGEREYAERRALVAWQGVRHNLELEYANAPDTGAMCDGFRRSLNVVCKILGEQVEYL